MTERKFTMDGQPWSNFALNLLEQFARLASTRPNFDNLQQALDQLSGVQWNYGPRESSTQNSSLAETSNDLSRNGRQSPTGDLCPPKSGDREDNVADSGGAGESNSSHNARQPNTNKKEIMMLT